jgi:CO/xanthine dehydrogenase FAD-binding subunit
LHLGALTRQRKAERDPMVRRHVPLLSDALPYIAHPQIRNRGTLGGSLAHADPAAELPAVAVTLGARLRLQSAGGERWLSARDFFTGFFTTALQPDELLTEMHVPPLAPRTGCAFDEVSRRHGDYALAGACALVTLDERGHIREARLTLLGVGGGPVASAEAARTIVGAEPNAAAFHAAAEAIDREIDPGSDIHATADFRRHLAKVLSERVLARAAERATHER